MSEYDAATYERFSGAVQRQVHALRVILDNLQVTFPLCTKSGHSPKLLEKDNPRPKQPVSKSHFRVDTQTMDSAQLTSPFFLSRKQ